MVHKKTISGRIFDVCNYMFLILLCIVTLYPFWYVVVCSFSDSLQLMRTTDIIIKPLGFNLNAYAAVLKNPDIQYGYRTTLTVVVFGTAFSVLMTSMGAFLLTRDNFRIKGFLSKMMIFTMYFSGGMIPTYFVVYKLLNLGDSLLALILPSAISTYNLLIMKSNMEGLPKSIEESAKIDGAGEFKILFKIVMPLSLPIIATMVLFYGVGHWNSWFNAMLYIRSKTKYPLQLVLRGILLQNNTGNMAQSSASSDQYAIIESIKYATIVVATVPILCVYPFVQKYFVKGMMIGAVKG